MVADFLFGGFFLYLAMNIAKEDLRTRIVPDLFLLMMFASGILYNVLKQESSQEALSEIISRLVFRSAAPSLSLLFIALLYRLIRRRDGLGMGDVKLMAAAGVWQPFTGSLYALTAASTTGIAAVLLIALRNKKPDLLLHSLPFALFLAPALWLSWLLGKLGVLPL